MTGDQIHDLIGGAMFVGAFCFVMWLLLRRH